MKLGNPESKLCGKFDKPFKYQYFSQNWPVVKKQLISSSHD